MSALRLVIWPAAGSRHAQLQAWRDGERIFVRRVLVLGEHYSGGWRFYGVERVDRARLARIIHLVPSSRSKVGKAILAGDQHARLRAQRGGAR